MRRPSLHVEPRGIRAIARHYIRDLVYGANDGLLTTFAVVAGVSGGGLPTRAVLIVCVSNLIADGLSMGVGNYLGIRSQEGARRAQELPEEEALPARHGMATFAAFVVAGLVPLLAFVLPAMAARRFETSIVLTVAALYGVGSARALVTDDRWWVAGLEMLGLGAAVAAAAYGCGALVALALA